MKKFSKLLAVALAIAVVICPMMSVVANAAGSPSGTYNISAENANDIVLTINSTDGFVVYQATVGFQSDSDFDDDYSSNGYEDGVKVISYTLKSAAQTSHNLPTITANAVGNAVNILVQPSDEATLDLYTKVVIGIRTNGATTASLTKIQAADEGGVADDPTLLGFPAAKADGTIDSSAADYNAGNATTNVHTHDSNNQTATDAYLKDAATCTSKAVYYKSCSVCGQASSQTFTSGDFAAHTPDHTKTNVKTPADCTTDAVYYDECSKCSAQLDTYWTDTNSKLGHQMTEHVATDSTCTVAGNTLYYSCSRCNKYFGDSNGANEVTENSWVKELAAHTPANTTTYVETPADCTTKAVYYQTCSVCNAKLATTWTGDALGHSWGDYASNNDATCTADGTKTRECSRCLAKDTVADPGSMLDHTYDQTTVKDATTLVAAATCKTYAKYHKTCSCGVVSTSNDDVYEDTAAGYDAANHTGEKGAWQSNDTNHWKVWDCCLAEADKAAHSYGEYTSNNDATHEADGTKSATCTCGKIDTVADPGSMIAHTYDQTTVKDDTTKVAAATCTTYAKYYKTCSCGVVSTSNDDVYEDTAAGYDAANHSGSKGAWQSDDTNHWKVWDCCLAEADKATHSYGEYTSNNDATHEADGTKSATCTCGKIDTVADTGSMIAHTYDQTTVKDATTLVAAATCTTYAKYHKTCTCGAVSTSNDDVYEDTAAGYDTANHSGAKGDWQSDETNHWKVWNCCLAEADKAAHTYDSDTDYICNDCGYDRTPATPKKYDIVWGAITYDITKTALNVTYKTTKTSDLNTEILTPHKTHNRTIDLCIKMDGQEIVFDNQGIGTADRTIPISGFSPEDMKKDFEVYVRVTYIVDSVKYAVYTTSFESTVEEVLATQATPSVGYDEYLAYEQAVADDTAKEAVTVASNSDDCIISSTFDVTTRKLNVTYRASSNSTTNFRKAMSTYKTANGRTVALVISVNGQEIVFDNQGVGTGDRTVPISGFSTGDMLTECTVFVRIYHDGTSETATGHTDSNAITFTIADAVKTGTSDASTTLAALLALS